MAEANDEKPPVMAECPRCGQMVDVEELIPAPDPYASEIYDDDTPVVACAECRYQRAMAI